jgi:hypothetical protein
MYLKTNIMKKELPKPINKLIQISLTVFLFILILFNAEQIHAQKEDPNNVRFSDEEISIPNATTPVKSQLKSASLMLKSADGSISVGENDTYNSYDAEQLVKNVLVTGCLQAKNIRFGYYNRSTGNWTNHNWSDNAGERMLGYFARGSSNFPIDEGLLLSTGKISSAMGPNNTGNKSDLMVLSASDPDLATITGRTMYDAAVLEFDFVPAGNTVEFKYVFASEEYIEYCETQYNDAFGFFLSGPGISGPYTNNAVNLATIPGDIPVSINTIHPAGRNVNNQNFPAENSQYYFDNPSGSLTMQFDGSTVEMTATYTVVPCQTYRIKMAVADASDQKWDAGVFLGARSFNSEVVSLDNFVNNSISYNIFEDCHNNKLVITRQTQDHSQPYTIDLILGGSAINGTDIFTSGGNPFPTQITIPANQASIEIPYYAIDDEVSDNNETFIVKVRNSCPCDINISYVEKIIHIYEKVKITSLVPQNAQCDGESNGVITVNATGGSGSYQYSINNGSTWQTSNTFSGLLSGSYTILVKDPGSCHVPVSQTTTIDQPSPIVANAGQDAVICSGTTVQLIGSGGVKYAWSPTTGLNNATIANPFASPITTTTYTLTVTNANGQCASSDQVTITVKPTPIVSVTPVEVEICEGTSTTLTASGALSYEWNPGGSTSSSITVSPNSNANYTVTGTGINGCTATASSTVIVKSAPRNVNAGADTYIGFCETYQLESSATGNNLTYTWAPSSNLSSTNIADPIFTPSASGIFSYTLTVTGENGCSETDEVKIVVADEVAATITAQTNVSCFNLSTGSATVTATGGVTPYTYSWNTSPEKTNATASGLTAGTYVVTVTDANGCTDTESVTISQPAEIAATIIKNNDVSCFDGNNGKLTVNATGGTGTLSYSIDGGVNYQTSNVFSELTIGTYTVIVKDANNCTKTTNAVIITQPAVIIWSCPTTPTSCFNGNDGTATITFSGGTAPYTLSINGDPFVPQTSPVNYNNLSAGNYTKVLKDANGCIKSGTFTVEEPTQILASVFKNNDISCNSGNDGKLTVSASGGTGSLQYSIDGGTIYQTSNVFEGLADGNYTVTVKDANECIINTQSVSITEPAILTGTDVQTACDSYKWIDGNIYTANNNTATYTLINAAGCDSVVTLDLTINNATAAITNNTGSTVITCSTTAISVTATGGVSYSWDGGATPATAENSFSAPGTYTVTVTGANGCTATESITITQDITVPTAAITNNTGSTVITCSTTAISVTATGGVSYSWDGGATPATAENSFSAPGTYTVTVTGANGCTATESITITKDDNVPTAAITNNTGSTVITCSTTAISVTATGGVSYSWDGGATPATAENSFSAPGTYTVTVTGANGCTATESITITQDITVPTAAITNNTGSTVITCSTTAISVTATGGVSYSWDGGATPATAENSFSAPGTYTVTVTGANGCTATESITITKDDTCTDRSYYK